MIGYFKKKSENCDKVLLIKRRKKPGLQSNPGLVLIDLGNNWALVFLLGPCNNSKSHNHFEVTQGYTTWECVAFLFFHLITIIKNRVIQWAKMSKY